MGVGSVDGIVGNVGSKVDGVIVDGMVGGTVIVGGNVGANVSGEVVVVVVVVVVIVGNVAPGAKVI